MILQNCLEGKENIAMLAARCTASSLSIAMQVRANRRQRSSLLRRNTDTAWLASKR
jgi:hypothetical protein